MKKGDGWYPLEGAIQDRGHDLFTPINKWFLQPAHKPLLHALMIFCAFIMDSLVLSVLLYFAFFGRSWRIFAEFLFFYSLRFTCQGLFAMQLPNGFYWEYPGFPSIAVPYGATNDFFYSGHVGACVLCYLEYRDISKLRSGQSVRTWGQKVAKFMQYLAVFSLPCQVFILLTTRGHYTIDMIAGGFLAHYAHIMTNYYVKSFDRKYIGIDSDGEEPEYEDEGLAKGLPESPGSSGDADDDYADAKAKAKSAFYSKKNAASTGAPGDLELAGQSSE